jgi:MFS family permease
MRNAILPLFAIAVVGKQPWVAGMALAVFAAGNAAGLAIAGRRADRIGRKPFIISGLVISGVATAVTGLAQDLTVLVIVSVVAGMGAGALNPAQQASLADVVGRERNGGPPLAAFQMSQDLGSILGPLIAGLLVDLGSYPLAFGVTGAITLLAAVPWIRARETHSKQPHPERA